MSFRLSHWIAALAAAGMLCAGCGALHSGRVATDHTGAGSAARSSRANDVSAEDLAEAHAHYADAVLHELRDESDLALQEYYAAALKDPADDDLVLEVSRRLLQAKQPEKALEVLKRATQRSNASAALYARLGLVYAQLSKPRQAAAANRAAIRKQPDSLAGYHNLFLNYIEAGQSREAQRVLDEAGKVPKANADFLIGLAAMYASLAAQSPAQKQVCVARASAALRRAQKMPITDLDTKLRLADAFDLIGDESQAAKLYSAVFQVLPDVPFLREGVREKLANIYLHLRDQEHAAEQLRAIVRDNPTDSQAYFLLGTIAYDQTNFVQAADYFAKTVLLNPDSNRAYLFLADSQMSAGNVKDALQTLDRAAKKFPPSFAVEYMTAMAFTREKDYTNALPHFTQAEILGKVGDTNRLSDVFYFQFGATCERAGDYAEAEINFEKCLKLAPDFAEALNYLGYMWADRGEKLDSARGLIEKALKADPKNAAYLDSMGWVLFKLKQPAKAVDYILKAIKYSDEEDATIYEHLGDIYAALGQSAKAHDAWSKSLSLEPSDELRNKLHSPGK